MTFKMEGLIQTLDVYVQFVAPVTIAQSVKRNGYARPRELHKYQNEAFEVAVVAAAETTVTQLVLDAVNAPIEIRGIVEGVI